MSNATQENNEMKLEPQPFKFFDITKISKGSLQRYQTYYQTEDPFTDNNSGLTLEQKVTTHFTQLKLDDKVVLEKFLRLKKDESALATKRPRLPKPTNVK